MRPVLAFLRRRGLAAMVGFALGALPVLAPALARHHSYTGSVTVAIWPGQRVTAVPDAVRMQFTAQVAQYMDTAPAQAVLQQHAAGLLGRPVSGSVGVVASTSLPFLTGTAASSSRAEVQALLVTFGTNLPDALAAVPGAPSGASEAPVGRVAVAAAVGAPLATWLVIAAALGVAAAVTVAALREWLDDRVRTWTRLRGLPLLPLAEVPNCRRHRQPALSRIAHLAARLDLAEPARRVVLVTSDCGGTGASSVAALLADAAAQAPGHVHLVQPWETSVQVDSAVVVRHRLDRLASPARVVRLLDRLAGSGGRVIVDVGPLTTSSTAHVVAAHADDVVVVVGLGVSRVSALMTLVRDLERRRIRSAGWVANHPVRRRRWRPWRRTGEDEVGQPAEVVLQPTRRRLRDLAAGEG